MEQSQRNRIIQSCTSALEQARSRVQEVTGRDAYSIQMEFLEWMVLGIDEVEVDYSTDHNEWEYE